MSLLIILTGGFLLAIGALIPRIDLMLAFGVSLSIGLLAYYFPNVEPFSVVIVSVACMFVGYVGKFLISDVVAIIRQSGLAIFLRASLWALVYSSPIFILLWLAGDARDWRERALFYGCSDGAETNSAGWWPFEHSGLYAAQVSENSELYAYVSSNGRRFLFQTAEKEPGPFYRATSWLPSWLRDPLTAPQVSPLHCPPPKAEADHEKSAIMTVDAYAYRLSAILGARVDGAIQASEAGLDNGSDAVIAALFGELGAWDRIRHTRARGADDDPQCDPRTVFPRNLRCSPEGLGQIAECNGWIRTPASCMQRRLQVPIYRAYQQRRDDLEHDVRSLGGNIIQTGEDSADAVRRITQRFIDTEIEAARNRAELSIQRWFLFWSIVSFAILSITIIMITKVFLHLLGRFLFSQNYRGGQVEFQITSADSMHSEFVSEQVIVSDSQEFSLPEDRAATWYVFWRSGVNWQRPEAGSPFFRPHQSFLRRLAFGKGRASVYQSGPPNGSVAITTALRTIKISGDQELIVNLRFVAAISEGIAFRTVFSPRLSAFLQRGLFFTVLSGEGTVLLSCEGGRIPVSNANVEPHRIVAMDRYGTYCCHAPLNGLDPYWHPFTIGPTNNSTMITFAPANDSDSASIKSIGRLLRNALFFILPI